MGLASGQKAGFGETVQINLLKGAENLFSLVISLLFYHGCKTKSTFKEVSFQDIRTKSNF